MNGFLHQVIAGIATGGIYASVALALVMIYQATHHVNFAQGEIFMIGGYVALSLLLIADWSYAVVIPVTVVAVAVGAALFQRVRTPTMSKHVVACASAAVAVSVFFFCFCVFRSPFAVRAGGVPDAALVCLYI